MASNSQHFSLEDRKIKLQLYSPSELELLNNGQAKRIMLGIYSSFFETYFFFINIIFFSSNITSCIQKYTVTNEHKVQKKKKGKLVKINTKYKIKRLKKIK